MWVVYMLTPIKISDIVVTQSRGGNSIKIHNQMQHSHFTYTVTVTNSHKYNTWNDIGIKWNGIERGDLFSWLWELQCSSLWPNEFMSWCTSSIWVVFPIENALMDGQNCNVECTQYQLNINVDMMWNEVWEWLTGYTCQ